jgi:hypothetical protein
MLCAQIYGTGYYKRVAHRSRRGLSTDALKSAQILMAAIDLGEKMGNGQAQVLPHLEPEQTLLLPPSPVDWMPENHLVFFLLDLASELDLEEIHAVYRQKDPRGEKAYEPRMMVVLLLYAYSVWLPSSRKIEKACWEGRSTE